MAHGKSAWRVALLATVVSLVALGGWGCGSSDDNDGTTAAAGTATSSTSSANEDVSGTLTFATSTSQQQGWDKVIDAFQKAYPNVKVRPSYIPIIKYSQVMATQFQAGQAPDVLYTSSGSSYPTSVDVLASQGRISDLSGLESVSEIPDSIKEDGMYEGKRYAMPISAWTAFWVYNKDKFNELGLTPPETLDELMSLCGEIAGKGLTPVAIGPTDGDLATFYAQLTAPLVQRDDPTWIQERNDGKTTFAGTEGWRKTLQTLVDMKDAKCFDSGVAGTSRDAALASFVNQKALMMPILQPQMGSFLAADPTFQWGVFATPGETPDQRTLFARVDPMLSINADAKNADAARAFVNFAMQPAQTDAYADAMGVISTGQFAKQELPSYLEPLAPYLFGDGETTLFITPQYQSTTTYTLLLKNLVGLLTGQVTVDGLLKELDDSYGE